MIIKVTPLLKGGPSIDDVPVGHALAHKGQPNYLYLRISDTDFLALGEGVKDGQVRTYPAGTFDLKNYHIVAIRAIEVDEIPI